MLSKAPFRKKKLKEAPTTKITDTDEKKSHQFQTKIINFSNLSNHSDR